MAQVERCARTPLWLTQTGWLGQGRVGQGWGRGRGRDRGRGRGRRRKRGRDKVNNVACLPISTGPKA